MNAYSMVATIFVSIFGMITAIVWIVSGNHRKVKVAEATRAQITLVNDTPEVAKPKARTPRTKTPQQQQQQAAKGKHAAPVVANARTGEVIDTGGDEHPQEGVNQTGLWAVAN